MDETTRRRRRRRFVAALFLTALAGTGIALHLDRQAKSRRALRGVGDPLPGFTLTAIDGSPVRLDAFRGRPIVIAFAGIDCPVGNLYMPRLVALAQRYRSRGVAFLALYPNAHETPEQIAAHAKEHGLPFPVMKDEANRVADAWRVERIGEAFLLDPSGRLRYRGALDDQYARGAFKPEPTRHYLAEALDAVLADKPVEVAVSSVITCPIERAEPETVRKTLRRPDPAFARLRRKDSPETDVDVGPVTYAEHVEPITRARCQGCHRPGEVGPFHLTSYDDYKRRADSIYEVVDQGLMPPWHADPRHGRWANDRSLTDRERATLLAWIEQGTPPGDLASIPPPPVYAAGWTIGQPDLVLEMAEAYDVPATGQIPIQKFRVPTGFSEDVWVQAAQAMPGDRAVVHHICVFVIDPAHARDRGGADWESRAEARPELVCYAPGDMPCVYAPGIAKKVPAGSVLEIQVHYQPIGVARFDRSSVGLVLARGPVRRMAVTRGAANRDFVLPPRTGPIALTSSYTFRDDAHLLSLTPHMHYRGRDFRYEAVFPDGRREVLLSVPYYDFNWQNVYRLAEPLFLPRGTTIECLAHFDNSAANPVNPDPDQTVRWGEQSTDEMMIGYLDFCVDLDQPAMAHAPAPERR
jgi:peroxiredoxin/mono/diheme cytochrome c family protein